MGSWDGKVSKLTYLPVEGLGCEPQWGWDFPHPSRPVPWST